MTGSYHLADNPDLYEFARSNNFEFVVTGLNKDFFGNTYDLVRAGYQGTESNAKIDAATAEETLRISVEESSVPHFEQAILEVRRGNSVMKAAGVPTFAAGSIILNDYVGADTKSMLMAWQNLSYDVATEKVGRMSKYKKLCYLMEYTPDFELIRTWELKGCWISSLTTGNFNQGQGDKRNITATIQYDSAKMLVPEEED